MISICKKNKYFRDSVLGPSTRFMTDGRSLYFAILDSLFTSQSSFSAETEIDEDTLFKHRCVHTCIETVNSLNSNQCAPPTKCLSVSNKVHFRSSTYPYLFAVAACQHTRIQQEWNRKGNLDSVPPIDISFKTMFVFVFSCLYNSAYSDGCTQYALSSSIKLPTGRSSCRCAWKMVTEHKPERKTILRKNT